MMFVSRYFLRSTRVAAAMCRSFQTSEASLARARRTPNDLPKQGTPNAKGDEFSEAFSALGEELEHHEPDSGFFERAYDVHVKETKMSKARLRAIMTKKKIFPEPKEPNMLTWNERQHIRYLHEQDPVEWSVETLSQSFPALPRTIKSVLNAKWSPSSIEKMKRKDKAVLENWEKLKNDALEASPELLRHLKKFVDKRHNLTAQLENPFFFHLPEFKQQEPRFNNGEMNYLLRRYEKQVKRLEMKDAEEEGGEERKMISGTTTTEELIKNEVNARDVEGKDSFFVGERAGRRGKEMTFEELQRSLEEKHEKGGLTLTEEEILRGKRDEGIRAESGKHVAREGDGRRDADGRRIDRFRARPRLEERGREERSREADESIAKESNVAEILGLRHKEEAKACAPEKRKPKVDYYGTEYDKERFRAQERELARTAFWNAKPRHGDGDAGRNVAKSPHAASVEEHAYPEKIAIPRDKLKKGSLYRVKDCYYDEKGWFVYRVPGMMN